MRGILVPFLGLELRKLGQVEELAGDFDLTVGCFKCKRADISPALYEALEFQ
jgi:hypothetical protein